MSEAGFLTILLTAVSLSMDCFAVSLSISIAGRSFSPAQFIKFPIAFGLFQAGMIALGWLAGRTVIDFIASIDHWLAFGLLAIIGGRMIWESFQEKDEEKSERDLNRWYTLLALSVATSIDSLAVGLSYAFLEVDIVVAAVTTGAAALIITLVGQLIGKRVGSLVGRWAETVGGIILILIGVRILLEHLLE